MLRDFGDGFVVPGRRLRDAQRHERIRIGVADAATEEMREARRRYPDREDAITVQPHGETWYREGRHSQYTHTVIVNAI
jgi:hypothetical protein